VDEGNLGSLLGERLERESDQGRFMAAQGERGDFPGWDVVQINWTLVGSSEHRDDAAERRGLAEER